MNNKFNDSIVNFIRDNAAGLNNTELAQKVNAEYGTGFSAGQIKSCKQRHKIYGGRGKKIGSEYIDKDGYTMIKIAEPQKWALKHRLIYERTHGKIPKEMTVIFLDGNKRNFDITNLKAISRAELAVMNRNKMFNNNPEITEIALNLTKLKLVTNKAKRKL